MTPRSPGRGPDALAALVLDRYLGVRRRETVTVEAWSHALEWARPFVLEARRRGAESLLVVEDEATFFRSLALAAPSLPVAPSPLAGHPGAYVYFGGPEAFPRLLGLPADDVEALVTRHGPAWWHRARRSGLRGVRMAIASVTAPAAARYGVDLAAWHREVLRGSLVDPARLARRARSLAGRLAHARRVTVRHANGTRLDLAIERASLTVADGRVRAAAPTLRGSWTQVPTGFVAVRLADGVAEGTWESNRPVYDRFADVPVAVGARFSFAGGRLVEFSFDRGGEAFQSAYRRGGHGRNRPTALTIGLNPAIDRAPEVGELSDRTVGLWLGDNRSLGGRNRSRFSYLTTLGGAHVELDGRPWWSDGRVVRASARRRGARSADRRP